MNKQIYLLYIKIIIFFKARIICSDNLDMKIFFTLLYFLFITFSFSQNNSQNVDIYLRPLKFNIRIFEKKLIDKLLSTYNENNKVQLKANYIVIDDFNKIRPALYSKSANKKYVCAISGFTITKIKKFEYSHPYFPFQEVFISKSNFKASNSVIKCGFFDNPFSRRRILQFSSRFKYKFIKYTNENLLRTDLDNNKNIDIRFADSYEVYFGKGLKVYQNIDPNYEFLGIIFPKNSTLKKILNPVLKKFIKSNDYEAMLTEHLGHKYAKEILNIEQFKNYKAKN